MVGMIRVLGVSRFAVALLLGTFWLAPMARAQDAADLLLRLDRLEAENRRLTGQVDELRFQIRKIEDQNRRLQTDTDTRFRDLEGTRGVIRTSPNTPVAPPAPQKRSDAFDPASAPPAPGTPRQLGSSGVATPPGAPLPVGGLPPGGQALQPGDPGAPLDVTGRRPPGPAPETLARGNANADFDFAKALIDRGDYEQAEGGFRDYLRTYAKDKRVPEATFWLGESYLRRTRYREAAEHFLTVTSKYPGAARAPEAMLKLGIALRGLGATAEACATFAQVTRKYPSATPAIRQAVEREKARAPC
jgi:tol-pal system protein YbgF